MVYETFQKTITSKLQSRFGNSYRLVLQKIPKNNGLMVDGLSISPRGQIAAPMIYLNHYYESFLEGRSIDALVEEIVDIYKENSDIFQVDFSMLHDFSKIKDRITYRMINTRSNRLLLEEIPSVPYLDLSIVFYLCLEQGPFGQMTALIHKRHQKLWDVSTERIMELARLNTPALFPADIRSMAQVMDEIMKNRLDAQYRPEIMEELFPAEQVSPLYVLTNSTGLNGAASMLYPGVLKNFADLQGRDLVILPSSIHEVLLVPYTDEIIFDDLADMVTTINQSEVPVEDRLSNHVYFYSRTADETIIAHDSASAYVS